MALKRTNVELDEEDFAEAMRNTGLTSKKAIIQKAVRELNRRARQRRLTMALKGKVHFADDVEDRPAVQQQAD